MKHPLSWIRSFETTARHGNFTWAANELGITQAAVSQHIKGLEERLDVRLFERNARGVTLTGVGAELYKSVAEGLGTIDSALASFDQPNEQRLYILCNTSLANNWLIPRLPEFLNCWPDLDIRLSTALWQTDALGVQADISLFFSPSIGGKLTELPGGEMIFVESTKVHLPSIVQVIGYERMFADLRTKLIHAKGSKMRLIECDSFHAALDIASAGAGHTIAPRLLANKGISDGTLRAVGSCGFNQDNKYWVHLHKTNSESSRAFVDWVVSMAERETR